MNHRIAGLTHRRLLIFCISLLSLVSLSLVVSVEAGWVSNGQQQSPAIVGPEKTVEQTKKNIQVLTGLPDSQLVPVMNYMGSSLGVKCTYCHVNKDGKWDFPSDEKPEKGTAREMIRMVQGINKANFKGNPAVGCFTCHRGRNEPPRVPQLPIATPTPFAEAAAAASPTPRPSPPTRDEKPTRPFR